MLNLISSSVALIGGADGPTAVTVSGELPLPAILVSVFAVAFVLYVYIMKAINSKRSSGEADTAAPVAAVAAVTVTAPVQTGPVLTNVEENEAAVIMAIVSDKTGIPLERLNFRSIKLMEDK